MKEKYPNSNPNFLVKPDPKSKSPTHQSLLLLHFHPLLHHHYLLHFLLDQVAGEPPHLAQWFTSNIVSLAPQLFGSLVG